MTDTDIIDALTHLAKTKLRHEGPLDDGELANQLDSVQRLTLVVAIEDHFKVCFDPEDEAQIRDLSDLVRIISKKLGEA